MANPLIRLMQIVCATACCIVGLWYHDSFWMITAIYFALHWKLGDVLTELRRDDHNPSIPPWSRIWNTPRRAWGLIGWTPGLRYAELVIDGQLYRGNVTRLYGPVAFVWAHFEQQED